MQTFPILYVEDEEDDVFLMQQALAKARVLNVFRSVHDGQQAIDYLAGAGEYADRNRFPIPGLVLLDLKLPYKSGLEVLRWIRNHALLKHRLVVICSSSSQEHDLQSAYENGANGYLVKPANFDKLLEMVEAIRDYWLIQNCPPFGRPF